MEEESASKEVNKDEDKDEDKDKDDEVEEDDEVERECFNLRQREQQLEDSFSPVKEKKKEKEKEKEKDEDEAGGEKKKCRDPQTIRNIQIMYIVAIVIWIIIIFIFSMYDTDILGYIILIIPFIVFGICYHWVSEVDTEVENFMMQGNFLYFGYIVILLVMNWNKSVKDEKIFYLIGLGIILIMLSMIDVWVSKEMLPYVRHFESIAQTLAAVIFAYILYYYYHLMSQEQFHSKTRTEKEEEEW